MFNEEKGHFKVLHRAEFYFAMVALIACVALLSEVLRTGHFDGLANALNGMWGWLGRYVSDVASAEVGAALITRLLGTGE